MRVLISALILVVCLSAVSQQKTNKLPENIKELNGIIAMSCDSSEYNSAITQHEKALKEAGLKIVYTYNSSRNPTVLTKQKGAVDKIIKEKNIKYQIHLGYVFNSLNNTNTYTLIVTEYDDPYTYYLVRGKSYNGVVNKFIKKINKL